MTGRRFGDVAPGSGPPLSAGLLLWRRTRDDSIEVLLGHMGGPYWSRRDDGAWSIPKGLLDDGEAPLDAARREFVEELGLPVPDGEPIELGEIRQSSKKRVVAWALELSDQQELDLEAVRSNTFEIEWPPRSGRMASFPEIDRAAWFGLDTARAKLVAGQAQLLDLLGDLGNAR